MSVLPVVVFIGVLSVCHSVTVYVDESATSNDCTTTTIGHPCNNLTASLEFIHATSIATVYIAQGSYSLLPSEKLKFKSVSDVTIAKLQGSNGTVHVNCAGMNAGLSFFNVTAINIQGIEFSGCGVVHNSTSRNFSVEQSLSLLNITVSLYFESCRNVNLSGITVTKSLGVAVQFFSTSGLLNEINDCEFSNNTVGGGLYIEFPYCIPGDNTCDQHSASMVDIASVSDSVYTISNCMFRNNTANSEDNGRTVLPYQSYHEAQGRGGGLSIFFKGNAKNNKFNIFNCIFENNRAVYGGGMYVEMQDLATSNKVETNSLMFLSNNASIDGGGLLASYIFLKTHLKNIVTGGSIILQNAKFDSNYVPSGKGGGVSFMTTRQNNTDWNNFMIINTNFVGNKAFLGSAVQIGAYSTEMNGILYPVQICNVTVNNNYIGNDHNKLGTGAVFVQSVPVDFSGNIEFTSNTIGSGLTAYQSNINVAKNTSMLFQDNIGHNGGALSLHDSTIIVNEGCSFEFIGNLAYIHGGAIYASFSGPDVQVMSQDCFIQYYDITLDPKKWDATFVFRDNRMPNHKVNSIYATSLKPCLFGRAFGVFPLENDHQKLQELFARVFCWNSNSSTIWQYNGNSSIEDCNYHIDTGLNHFNMNNNSLTNIDIVPGKVTLLDLQGIDDQGEPIRSEIILHARSKAYGTEIDKDYKYTSSNNIVLLRKNADVNQTDLNIETIGQEVPVVLRISARILDCPPGFNLSKDGKCKCMKDFRGIIKCDDSRFTAYLLSGFWMGIDNDNVIVSHCRDCNTSLVHNGYYNLSLYANYTILGKSLCGENREGVSCSTCVDGYAPAINLADFKCVECDLASKIGGIFLFLLLDVFVPLSLLAIVYILDVPLTNGLLHGPIFFAQMITTVVSLDGDRIIHYKDIVKDFNVYFEQVYITLYDIFNLDFFMSFQSMCLGSVSRYATIVSIHYASALLPLLFVLSFGLFIFLFDRTRRFRCINSLKNCMKSRFHNLPNILATCILLSYTKVMVITCYMLTPIVVIGEDGKFNDYRHSVLYIDGSIHYSSKEYYPYLVAPVIVALCFLIPVPIFLAVFRSNDAANNSGFFNNLLEQFQKEFRQSKEDFPMFNRDGSYIEMDEQSVISPNQDTAIIRTFCNPYKGCGVEIDNRTEYERECCSPQYLCRYYQKKSRYCPIAINTSCSFYDYRWFAGGFFALRVLLILPYMLAWTTMIRYSCQLCICMFGGMFIILVRPYKRKVYKYFDCNRVEALSLFNLGFILALCIYQYHYTTNMNTKHSLWAYAIQVFLVMVPFVWIVVVYVYLMKERHSQKFDKWIRPCLRWCCGKPDGRHSNNDLSERHNSEEVPTSVRLISSNRRSKSRSQTWSQSRPHKNDYVPLS